ncbi:MAG: DEAD/DEAH box helicase [Fusobacteriota bacterium]
METLKEFRNMGLSEEIIEALKKKGFEEPTAIQKKAIPLLLEGKTDLIGQAQTGTGKTAAFGLPIIEKLKPSKKREVQALILTPTRELANQVSEELNSLKGHKNLTVFPIYGGQSIGRQINKLERGVDIVVGTPGRLIDLIGRGKLKLDKIKYMILDEADEMLNMGFIDDIEEILKATPKERTMLLFSATMPRAIKNIAKRYMRNYKVVSVKNKQLTADLTEQIYFEVPKRDRFEALSRIIDIEDGFYGIVFCRTKVNVDKTAKRLRGRGYDAEAIHGDIPQNRRERVLGRFKDKETTILVGTDVAARGIDVDDLTHVINYSLPQNPESYVHRIGRTGRAGKKGTAITFISSSEYRKLSQIKRKAKTKITKQNVPKVSDVLDSQKDKLKENIDLILEKDKFETYNKIAEDLLEGNDPKEVLAAVLKHTLKGKLTKKDYMSSNNDNGKIDPGGVTRLFIAKGRKTGMAHPKKLVKFVQDRVNISNREIDDIKILDKFSFMTVPFKKGEEIIQAFSSGGGRPVIEKAKSSK